MMQMAQEASGADYVSGTFTTGNTTTYKIEFGKTFSNYLYLIEMTGESKTALMNSGQTSAKMFACIGMYPPAMFDNSHPGVKNYMSNRINPSTLTIDYSTSATVTAIDETSITFGNHSISNGANSLYRGYSYTYYIVEVK